MKRIHVLLIGLLIAFGVSLHAVQSTINVGSSANDGTGDTLRSAMQKVNSNFTELYGTIFSFNGNQFGTSSSTNVYIKSGATLTNSVLYGSTSGSWTVGSDGTITAASSSATNMLSANIVNNSAVSSRARQGGLAFDGVTAQNPLSFGTIVSWHQKTSPWSLSITFSASDISNGRTLFYYTYAGAMALRVALASSGYVAVAYYDLAGSAYTVDKLVTTAVIEVGKVYTLVIAWDGSSTMTSFLNGVSQTLSGTPGLSISGSSAGYIGGYAASASFVWNGIIYGCQPFTRALSASEVVDLANKGVAEADKWASLTAKRAYDWSAGVDGWVANAPATTTVARDAGPTVGVSNNLSVTDTGVAGNHLARSADSPLVIGKRYRITYSYYWPVANSSNYSYFILYSRDGSTILETVTPIKDGAWHTRTLEFTASSAFGPAFYIYNASNTFNFTGTAGDVAYFNAVSITEVGCLLDADLAVGVGYQAPDQSSNHYDGLLSTTGVSHTREERRGQARFSLSADGYLGDTTSRACIPADARIESIVAYSTGTPTFTIGDDSGSAANVVGSVTLTASTLTDLTLLKRFLTTGTEGRCYVDFTSGAAATTFTITYSTTGNY